MGKPVVLAKMNRCGAKSVKRNGKISTIRTTDYVQCEPMRYGLHESGQPFCVQDGKNASNQCQTDSSKDPAAAQWAKAIREALPESAKAYDENIKEVCDSRAQESQKWNNHFVKGEPQWNDIENTCKHVKDSSPATQPGAPIPPAGTPATPEAQPTSAPSDNSAPTTTREDNQPIGI